MTEMTDSILNTIKKLIGPSITYDVFDFDLIIHINSALMVLNQLGVGPKEGFKILDETETWSDFLGTDVKNLEAVKTYIYLKVRMVFDPPTTGATTDAFKEMIKEYEWRLNVQVDPSLISQEENN